MPVLYSFCQTIPTNFICGGIHFWVQMLVPNLSHRDHLANKIEKKKCCLVYHYAMFVAIQNHHPFSSIFLYFDISVGHDDDSYRKSSVSFFRQYL